MSKSGFDPNLDLDETKVKEVVGILVTQGRYDFAMLVEGALKIPKDGSMNEV